MSDYTFGNDFSVKDALPDNDPDKLILGADLDTEFEALETAIATKYDSSDIATEAQAIAGASNSVLITPLRMAQYVAGSGAGVVGDLIALTDPGADRILFWDDSDDAVEWLTVGTGLSITGNTLSANAAAVDHDALLNFEANEHIDHSAVSVTAGTGLSGGGAITSTVTLNMDIDSLTAESSLDFASDYLAFYDDSAAAHRKTTFTDLLGSNLGDGTWYRNGNQAISASTATTLVFNAEEYDELQRGTFSTAAGTYTRGSDAGRIFIQAVINCPDLNDSNEWIITIQVNGTTKIYHYDYRDPDDGTNSEYSWTVGGNLNLAASDVVRVQVECSNGENVNGTNSYDTTLHIIELS